jgi:hypothetical protein
VGAEAGTTVATGAGRNSKRTTPSETPISDSQIRIGFNGIKFGETQKAGSMPAF